ncbi:hypothetical protein OXPF_27320 [Oxobacter pfennigii]|uniref:Uncharacterized protein n=1 Tax=Oxobacter pfennigii TaxID=36849 RepID=A0A0P8W6D8_9CLOT|nr:hypothetical protein [Oxobacter pfennigii]KPU43291.1 hypothetical protein OXPF_27320 [Oxobacter pfennigii]
MNLRAISISALLLLMIFLMYNILGVGTTILIFAIIFLAWAVLLSIKPEYYDKFLSFMNPGLYCVYKEKGTDFIRKKRRIDIIGYYIISVVTGLNAFMQIKLRDKFDISSSFSLIEILPFAIVVVVVIFIINYICILIAKKSKTADEDLTWNIIVGIIFAIILIGFISLIF